VTRGHDRRRIQAGIAADKYGYLFLIENMGCIREGIGIRSEKFR